jgi:hypothetical protein
VEEDRCEDGERYEGRDDRHSLASVGATQRVERGQTSL